MNKLVFVLITCLCFTSSYASKLSKYMDKMDAQEKAEQQREWQQDMNFADLSFRLERRFVDDRGQRCRAYVFRARSNPYRHGQYIACDER